MGNAKSSAYSFKNHLDVLSDPEALAGLSCVQNFRTLDSLTCRKSGDFSKSIGGKKVVVVGDTVLTAPGRMCLFAYVCGDNNSNSSILI